MTHAAPSSLSAPTPGAIRDARARIAGVARRTPLLEFAVPAGGREVHLKLENLQPIGSFKLRGAANVMLSADPASLAHGVYTASAGNMGQGVAWMACRGTGNGEQGIPCTIVVPDRAPQVKLDALARLGATILKVPFDVWWTTMVEHQYPGLGGVFVHPFEDERVMAGNGTIGLEILEDLNDVDAVLVPWGGGGLAAGIAAAVRAVSPRTRVFPVEVETAAPLAASYAAGAAASVTPQPSFVDGMGGKSVFPSMWPLAQSLLERPLVVSVAEIAAAVRVLAERARIVAEGAGAAPLAAALSPAFAAIPGIQRVVCIVSGGNIDHAKLATILRGEVP